MLPVLETRRDNIQRLMDLIAPIYGFFGSAGLMRTAAINEADLSLTETRGHLQIRWEITTDDTYDPAKTACNIELRFDIGSDHKHSTLIGISADDLTGSLWIGRYVNLRETAYSTGEPPLGVTQAEKLVAQFNEFADEDMGPEFEFTRGRAMQLIRAMLGVFCGKPVFGLVHNTEPKLEAEPVEPQGIELTEEVFQDLKDGDQVIDNEGHIWFVRVNTMRQDDCWVNLFRSETGKIFQDVRWYTNDLTPRFRQSNDWVRDFRFEGSNVRVIKQGTWPNT